MLALQRDLGLEMFAGRTLEAAQQHLPALTGGTVPLRLRVQHVRRTTHHQAVTMTNMLR